MESKTLLIFTLFALVCGQYVNPVINQDHPDPGAIWYDGYFYVATTGGGSGGAFPIHQSADLVNWTQIGFVFPQGMLPGWAVNSFWAPELHLIQTDDGDQFNVYFAARESSGLLCVGVGVSTEIGGPYKDIGAPLVQVEGMGSIDPTYWLDYDGESYVIWKSDGNAIGQPTPIWAQPVTQNGTAFLPGSSATQLITNTLDWEGPVTEGPWLINQNGVYYLFYSANVYSGSAYCVGVASANNVLGPYTKQGTPIITTDPNNDWIGPGHCSVMQLSESNQTWMIYHAWTSDLAYRAMLIDEVVFGNDGWPSMANGNSNPSYTAEADPQID